MSRSWGFSVGNVRAKEASMLRREDIDQFAALRSQGELAAALRDKGFGSGDKGDGADVDRLIKDETAAVWEYAKTTAADITVFYPLMLDNDYHNLKTAVKGILSGREYRHLMLGPTVTDTDTIIKAVEQKRFSDLPEYMADDAKAAYLTLAETSDAQLFDGILDKSRMKASMEMSRSVDLVHRYIACKVFFENVKTALRAAKMGKDRSFLEKTIYEDDGTKGLIDAAESGEAAVLSWLGRSELGGEAAVKCYKESPSRFEKYADDRLMEAAKAAKTVTIGPEVIIGYIIARLAVIRAVSMVATGIRTGTDPDVIRERLRELYD